MFSHTMKQLNSPRKRTNQKPKSIPKSIPEPEPEQSVELSESDIQIKQKIHRLRELQAQQEQEYPDIEFTKTSPRTSDTQLERARSANELVKKKTVSFQKLKVKHQDEQQPSTSIKPPLPITESNTSSTLQTAQLRRTMRPRPERKAVGENASL